MLTVDDWLTSHDWTLQGATNPRSLAPSTQAMASARALRAHARLDLDPGLVLYLASLKLPRWCDSDLDMCGPHSTSTT